MRIYGNGKVTFLSSKPVETVDLHMYHSAAKLNGKLGKSNAKSNDGIL